MFKISSFLKGVIGIVSAQVCWSIVEVIGVLVYKTGVNPVTVLSIRFIVAFALMFLTFLFFNRKLFVFKKEDIKRLFVLNIILFIHLIGFWQGLKMINHVPTAIGIYFTFPLWIVVFSRIFLKENIGSIKKFSLVAGTMGAILILKAFTAQASLMGEGLMLVAAITWAFYALVGKTLFKKYSPLTILFYNFLFIAIVINFLQPVELTASQLSSKVIFYLVLMGVVSTYFAYILFYWGLKFIRSSTAGILALTKPIISIGLAFFVLGQQFNFWQFIGMVLIVISILLINTQKNEEPN